ncbi:MAG TPA: hypothetical protein VGE74_26455 [Gemmata sp.]
MFEVVICTVNSGRVQRKPFGSWEEARAHVDFLSAKHGRQVRLSIERAAERAAPVRTQASRVRHTGRTLSA